jgi:hypothetical protein
MPFPEQVHQNFDPFPLPRGFSPIPQILETNKDGIFLRQILSGKEVVQERRLALEIPVRIGLFPIRPFLLA